MSNEKPLILQDRGVRATLQQQKTQTRRVIKTQPLAGASWQLYGGKCPYGKPGDYLWVREAWAAAKYQDGTPPRELSSGVEPPPLWYRATQPNAQNGECLPEALRCGKWRPSIHMPRWASRIDLLITDLYMPKVDGIQLIKNIREKEEYQHLPILFLTTESQKEKKQEAKSAGATGWIIKPFVPDKLLSAVSKVMR